MKSSPRTCVVCEAVAPPKWTPGKGIMLSLSVLMFRRDARTRQLKIAPALHVCEDCMRTVTSEKRTTMESELLSEALLNRVRDRYNSLPGVKRD